MSFDITTSILIVGGGPAGLACAWRLRQLNPDLQVTLIDKAASAGGQLVSGAAMDPAGLDELWPEWRDHVPYENITHDRMLYLTNGHAVPLPSLFGNKDNVIISINALGAALAEKATEAGADILFGFAGKALIGNDKIDGIECTDGTRIGADHVILAEGCFGNLSERVIERFELRSFKDCHPCENGDPHTTPAMLLDVDTRLREHDKKRVRHQTYGLGIKEIWRVNPDKFKAGLVEHTIGFPLPQDVHGGGWIYHYGDNIVSLGLITALDYDNPTLSPFDEMQQWKTHPHIKSLLEGGTRIGYQARALVEGGLQSLPKLDFPGGILIGDAAGFLNPARLKGIHMALQSGMLAAQAITEHKTLQSLFDTSPMRRELWRGRNVRGGFRYGRFIGMINAVAEMMGCWRGPFTFPAPAREDRKYHNPNAAPRVYPAPDNVLTFDKLSSLALCAMTPPADPCHLHLKNPDLPEQRKVEPAPAYCPAAVYEFAAQKFVINHANCVHCKTCAIKDPDGNIVWTPNSGGSGSSYESI